MHGTARLTARRAPAVISASSIRLWAEARKGQISIDACVFGCAALLLTELRSSAASGPTVKASAWLRTAQESSCWVHSDSRRSRRCSGFRQDSAMPRYEQVTGVHDAREPLNDPALGRAGRKAAALGGSHVEARCREIAWLASQPDPRAQREPQAPDAQGGPAKRRRLTCIPS